MPHPFVNLGPIILDALGAPGAITVHRKATGGTYVNGVFTAGAETNTSTDAVVQPSSPREVEQLPEGERVRESITVYTGSALIASSVDNANRGDEVSWDGRRYQVRVVEDWTAQAQYSKSICVRVGP